MRRLLLSLPLLSMAFFACKEQLPAGLVLTQLESKDTTYVTSTLEIPQTKRVLIEEMTGASCTNCPNGTKMLKEFQQQHPDRIIITAIHAGFLTNKPNGAKYYFPNPDSEELRLFFGEGDPTKPSATFDRVPATGGNSAGKYFITRGQTGADWIDALPPRLAKTTPANLHLESTLDPLTQQVNIKAKIAFTESFTDKLCLTLYVLEDSIIDIQLDKDLGPIQDYVFNHVFRKLVTPVGGELILDSLNTKQAGRVLEKFIKFTPNTSADGGWKLNHCHLVGILHRTGSSREVLHAVEVKLN